MAWFTPCGATKINGVAIGVQAMNVDGKKLAINGINVDAGMGGVVATFYGLFSSFPFKKKTNLEFLTSDSAATSIKGISISMGGELAVSITGINIAGGTTGSYQLKGISITGIYTKTVSFDGICISGIHNIANKGVGIQIGLFNYCKNLKGIQIGLWNKSGNRDYHL